MAFSGYAIYLPYLAATVVYTCREKRQTFEETHPEEPLFVTGSHVVESIDVGEGSYMFNYPNYFATACARSICESLSAQHVQLREAAWQLLS